MLLGQDFGWGHQGRLRPVGRGHNHGRGGHGRLARTDIPLQQTVHRPGLGHVGANLLNDALLRARQPEGQGGQEGVEALRRCGQRPRRVLQPVAPLPLDAQLQQLSLIHI